MRDQEEVLNELQRAVAAVYQGDLATAMLTYEEGVVAALAWVLNTTDAHAPAPMAPLRSPQG